MVKATYIDSDGVSEELDVPEGWTLMQAAISNGLDGIEGECGGSCCCATCHVYVDEAYLDKLEPMSDNENGLLDNTASERKTNSRLACQIKASADLDGIVIQTPEAQ
ncbi:MAG: 2Fe-2S iron-sulfur cluster-binding protein [Candidatus Thiodiazotropha sp.]|jgi:ferredoxin, 2Fe-2S